MDTGQPCNALTTGSELIITFIFLFLINWHNLKAVLPQSINTELLYFFVAAYSPDMKLHDGGGLQE